MDLKQSRDLQDPISAAYYAVQKFVYDIGSRLKSWYDVGTEHTWIHILNQIGNVWSWTVFEFSWRHVL